MLDTLEALAGPMRLDTLRAESLGAPEADASTKGRIVLNPAAVERAQRAEQAVPGARIRQTDPNYVEGFMPAAQYSAYLLSHEWLGHGQGITNEKISDYWARSFLRLSGRVRDLEYTSVAEAEVENQLRDLLQTLQEWPNVR